MEQHFWKNRYETKQTGWNIGSVSPPIAAYLEQLTNKEISILIPGAGIGHEANFAFENGFHHVYPLDFVSESKQHFLDLFPHFPADHYLLGDFFALNQSFDLILEQTFFCAIHPSRRKEYVEKMHSILKPNGKLVGVLFDREFESGPPFGGNRVEYEALFSSHFQIETMESCYNSIPPRIGSELFVILSPRGI